jgi:hypothetical protein
MSSVDEYVKKLVKSIAGNPSDVAELLKLLSSHDDEFFKDVMTQIHKRYVFKGENYTEEEITENVWYTLLSKARTALHNGEEDVASKILKAILDGSETHP